jgi:hypothetical protein
VNLQATAVYLFSIIVCVIHYSIGRAATKASMQDDDYNYNRLTDANITWSVVVAYFLPILFFVYVCITIKCRGYMPSATGSMKQLVSLT